LLATDWTTAVASAEQRYYAPTLKLSNIFLMFFFKTLILWNRQLQLRINRFDFYNYARNRQRQKRLCMFPKFDLHLSGVLRPASTQGNGLWATLSRLLA